MDLARLFAFGLAWLMICPAPLWGAEPCAARSIGPGPSLATGWGSWVGTYWGEALGQRFYAADTLIRSITVWRPVSDPTGIPIRLYLLNTHTSWRDGLPEPDRQAFFTGPVVDVMRGDDEHPIRCEFYLDPPLALPRPGTYCFALQSSWCAGRLKVLSTGDSYPAGEAWFFGRLDCVPALLGHPTKVPTTDWAFRIEFVNPAVPVPVTAVGTELSKCRTRVTWVTSGSDVQEATVFRRTLGTDWIPLGQAEADGVGRLVFDDTLVVPGQRYGYRLGLASCENDPLFGEIWETAAGGLNLKIVRAETVAGRLRLTWTSLPGAVFPVTVYRWEVQTFGNIPADST